MHDQTNATTTVTPTETGVVINHTGNAELHLHFHFTIVAASPETLAKIGDIQQRLQTSQQALQAATAAAV